MADNLRVAWSLESSRKVQDIKSFLRNNWSEKEVDKFLKRIQKFELLVTRFPKLYPASLKHPNLRKAVISKHHSLIYGIADNIIRIYTILDHRQEN